MKYTPGTVAELIERFIKEMDGGVRPLGESHRYTLRRIQREPIGAKVAVELEDSDIIDFCRARRNCVVAATVGQDFTFLTGVFKYAKAAWRECKKIPVSEFKDSKTFLMKNGLVGKSQPRTRRPTKEEKAALEAHFAQQNEHPRTKTDMVRVSKWQHASSRRIGESCALLWPDWNPDKQTIFVRKMKDPKNRAKQKIVALPWDAQALLYEWAYEMNDRPELRDEEPRILPYNDKTCSQRYTLAKKLLGIENLHLHDDRRDRGSRLVEEDGHSAEEAIQYTGHDTTDVFQRTYMVLDPAIVAEKGRRMRDETSKR